MKTFSETIAGALAGTITTLAMHPLDLVKARMQVGTVTSFKAGLRELLSSPRSAYRGLSPNLLGNAIAWGAYYGLYGELQRILRSFREATGVMYSGDGQGLFWQSWLASEAFIFWAAALSAGMLTQVATNPVWVLKTRMLGSHRNEYGGAYESMYSSARAVWKQGGILAFWRGFAPGLVGPFQSSLYFVAYELTKQQMPVEWADTTRYVVASGLAKSIAATAMYPHQVIRSRMQYADVGFGETCRQIWRGAGIKGFYNGLSANLARVVPAITVTQVIYEVSRPFIARAAETS